MRYAVWLEMSHIMAEEEATTAAEARQKFNRRLNFRRVKNEVEA